MTLLKHKRIALIPARGGSKRLPRKNILDFVGQPIIAYTITAALETELFDRVIVSTEDDEIAEISESFGAEISKRAQELAGDTTSVAQVALDLISREHAKSNIYDQLAVLYATAPLRGAADITATINLLEEPDCDFAIAVTEYNQPIHQALVVGDSGSLRPWCPELVNERGDSVDRLLVDNGSTYAVSVSAFTAAKTFYGATLKGHEMPRERSIDIDTHLDFEFAKIIATRQQNQGALC